MKRQCAFCLIFEHQCNAAEQPLSAALAVDLWTLDVLWHYLTLEPGDVVEDEEEEEEEEDGESLPPILPVVQPEARFGLERHLHDFLWENWDSTELRRAWKRHTEAGDERAGYEYRCDVGRVDILARHRTTGDWLVVELKRDRTSDATAAQAIQLWLTDHKMAALDCMAASPPPCQKRQSTDFRGLSFFFS